MGFSVEHDVFVNFVRQQVRPCVAQQFGQLLKIVSREDRARGIVREIDDDEPGLVVERILEALRGS